MIHSPWHDTYVTTIPTYDKSLKKSNQSFGPSPHPLLYLTLFPLVPPHITWYRYMSSPSIGWERQTFPKKTLPHYRFDPFSIGLPFPSDSLTRFVPWRPCFQVPVLSHVCSRSRWRLKTPSLLRSPLRPLTLSGVLCLMSEVGFPSLFSNFQTKSSLYFAVQNGCPSGVELLPSWILKSWNATTLY